MDTIDHVPFDIRHVGSNPPPGGWFIEGVGDFKRGGDGGGP